MMLVLELRVMSVHHNEVYLKVLNRKRYSLIFILVFFAGFLFAQEQKTSEQTPDSETDVTRAEKTNDNVEQASTQSNTSATPEVFNPSEEILDDSPVPFPVDI